MMTFIMSGYLFDGIMFSWTHDSRFSRHFDEATCPHMEPDVAPILLQVPGSSCAKFLKVQNHQPANPYVIVSSISANCNVNDASATV